MSFCVDIISEDSFFENITLGVTKLLESDPRITNVIVERREPCDRIALSNWEQKHSVILPEDLRNFYISIDGFLLKWHYKYSADEILPVGSIRINSLNNLILSSSLKELLDISQKKTNHTTRPLLNSKSKIFELDNCRSIGKVCLVYSASNTWSVWFLSCDGTWAWLADSFTNYFRMALVHLGLPGWPALFADVPLISWAEQLFLLLAPHLLEKTETDTSVIKMGSDTIGLNHIDPNIFKTTTRHHKKGNQ